MFKRVRRNIISNTINYGINIGSSFNNSLVRNNITSNWLGILITYSSYNNITKKRAGEFFQN